MQYLSATEFARYKGCTDRAVRKLIAADSLAAELVAQNGKTVYRIPVTELPAAAQHQYYKDHGIKPPQVKKPTVQRPAIKFEELTDDQRKEAAMWAEILDGWSDFCAAFAGCKCDANEAYAEQVNREYPVKVSVKTLYRKRAAYKAGGIVGLVDMRGRQKRGSVINDNLWQCFLYHYLDQSKHPVKACYDYTRMWAEQEHPELLPMPSYSTFYRRIEREIPLPVQVLGRDGQKAYRDRCGLYIKRTYDDMASNEWWIADNHTFDVMIRGDNGKPHRLYLTAFFDARSGIFTGCYVTTAPSSQATLYALRRGILQYGIPDNIYVDNGREFLTFDVGGLGHRKRKSQQGEFAPPPIFERLGIKMTNALVRNARAKIIERRFRDVKDRLSRLFVSYTGGNVIEKPERLKQVIKGDIVTDNEFTAMAEDLLAYYFNEQEYGGAVEADHGKTRMQVYQDNLHSKRVASADDLDLMLMRSSRAQKVGRRGVHLNVGGSQIDYINDELRMHWMGEQVYLRYDPADLSTVRVYDLDNRYITTASCDNKTVMAYGASKDDVQSAMRELRRQERMAKDELNRMRTVALGKRMRCRLSLLRRSATRRHTRSRTQKFMRLSALMTALSCGRLSERTP